MDMKLLKQYILLFFSYLGTKLKFSLKDFISQKNDPLNWVLNIHYQISHSRMFWLRLPMSITSDTEVILSAIYIEIVHELHLITNDNCLITIKLSYSFIIIHGRYIAYTYN